MSCRYNETKKPYKLSIFGLQNRKRQKYKIQVNREARSSIMQEKGSKNAKKSEIRRSLKLLRNQTGNH